jgi:hypothetical protein
MAQKAGGGSLEGTGYGYSYLILYDAYKYWKDSGQGDLSIQNSEMENTILYWAHASLPGLKYFMPLGSQSRQSIPQIYDYYRALVMLAQYLADDPQAKAVGGWWLSHIVLQHANVYRQNYIDDLFPYSDGPAPSALTFRAAEAGMTVGRTSWSSAATLMQVLMGNFSESHAHPEQGSFVFWSNGTWGSVTNNIFSRSGIEGEGGSGRDKNVVLFRTSAGEIRQRYGTTAVTNYSANYATGDFHITGDMSSLYDHGISWKRSVDFVGGVGTVTDQFNLPADTTATFQLNVPGPVSINGNVIISGHLKATVLSPADAHINVVPMTSVDSDYISGNRIDITGSNTGYVVKLEAV